MNHCVNWGYRDTPCNHDETQHDESGCLSCACSEFRDEEWLQGQEESGGGGHDDSDPTYRQAMQGAGRSLR
jgi:hypothetical protein